MESDPKHDSGILGLVPIRFDHRLLELDRGPQSINCAWELGQRTVAGQLN
jgi:hypothetical protein